MRDFKFRAWAVNLNKMIYGSPETIFLMKNKQMELKLMQYTGIKDMWEKEIYEGDIVYLAGLGPCEMEYPFLDLFEASAEREVGEILGNIFENKSKKDLQL